jgi:CheY-like chemotaxis protein
MKPPYRFLLLDDDEDALFLNTRALEKAFPHCAVQAVTSCDAALAALSRQSFDALLADHHLRGQNGSECIARIRALGLRFPILVVTGSEDPDVYAAATAAGATAVCSPLNPDFVACLRRNLSAAE